MSIVIPTLNEAARIGRLVVHLRQHADHRLADILVVDGQSDDDTAETARAAGARVLVCPTRSRAAQMNLGAREATGDVLYALGVPTCRLRPLYARLLKRE